jgi:hypothetical protein
MSEIEIGEETAGQNQWSYPVRVFAGGQTYDYQVTLSWSDYDLWCRGRVAPSEVVERIFEFLLHREPPSAIMSKFDCSVVRRYFPDVDEELPKMI